MGNSQNNWNKAEWQRLHAEYLKTDEWHAVQRKVIERDGRCQRCKADYIADGSFHVHHTHYRYWREANWEEVDSCILLCDICHCLTHHGVTPMAKLDAYLEDFMFEWR